jgi:protoheme IX farnesyltransferase
VKPSRLADWVELTKPRIVVASSLAALAGGLAASHAVDPLLLVVAIVGVGLVSSSAGMLNQVLERATDALMPRTASRPLPAGRVTPLAATVVGVALGVGGLALLAWRANGLTTALAFFALVAYLFVYTPLKRVTSFNTFVGAVPGALPPVLGWSAVANDLGPGAYALFALMFLWQLPHFLSIAWLYRDDYARGGMHMLPEHDPAGAITSRQVCVHAVALCVASLLPFAFGLAGPVYLVGAVLLGIYFLVPSFRFLRDHSDAAARRVLVASLVYLPGVLCLVALRR